METPSEQRALIRRAQAGDFAATGELVERHRAIGQRLARRMIGDPDAAADIVQDASVEAVRSIGQLREPDRFSSWFCGIVLNLCRSYLRSRARVVETSLDLFHDSLQFEAIDFASTEPDPADAVVEKDIQEKVSGAVRELPAALRAPTLLYYFEHLTLREIGTAMGISVTNVKVRLHRARLRLRQSLSASGLAPEAAHDGRERGDEMARVKVFDVLHRTHRPEPGSEPKPISVVMLVDAAMERTLPIWMGRAEATAIALAASNKMTPRPMTASLMATLLREAQVEVKEARIARLEGDTYYAEVEIASDGQPRVIDARPSDAIALALNSGAPFHVADEIMQKASIEIPRDGGGEPRPRGIEEVIRELEQTFAHPRRRTQARGEAERALVKEVFGAQV
ncbi:MAG: bifunctional nuclease family protein [Chloroflexi bacterium]|nr:bifunctional nuclease family protein [Chloroflexota bacterium]